MSNKLCVFILIFIAYSSCNKNNLFVEDKVVYLSIKKNCFLIDGDIPKTISLKSFQLERVLDNKQIEYLENIIANDKYHIQNIDIIDVPVEGCYVFFKKNKPIQIIYYLSSGQKLVEVSNGTKKEIYLKEYVRLP